MKAASKKAAFFILKKISLISQNKLFNLLQDDDIGRS